MRIPSPLAIAASLALNAAALFSVERASVRHQQTISQQESLQAIERKNSESPLDFEFIESPAAPSQARKPIKTNRISDRDTVNQDQSGNQEASPEDGPRLKQGHSNQLAQEEGMASPPPSPPSQESEPKPEQQEQAAKPPAPEEAQTLDDGASMMPAPEPQAPGAEAKQASEPAPDSKASPPSPPAPQSMARDKITAAEMTRLQSMGAQLQGQAAFEAAGTETGAYIRRVKEKIWMAWYPYVMSNYPKDFKTADAMVSFVIDPQGNLKSVRILDSHGSQLFAAFCVEAVQSSSPFGPPPQEALEIMGRDELEIKFGFHYR